MTTQDKKITKWKIEGDRYSQCKEVVKRMCVDEALADKVCLEIGVPDIDIDDVTGQISADISLLMAVIEGMESVLASNPDVFYRLIITLNVSLEFYGEPVRDLLRSVLDQACQKTALNEIGGELEMQKIWAKSKSGR
jgi:hypothetical protein